MSEQPASGGGGDARWDLEMTSRDGSSGRVGGDERHSKGIQPSSRRLFIARGCPASEKVSPSIQCSRNMLHSEVELGESKRPTLRLVTAASCNVGVEAGRREHVQDVLVIGEQREFSTCGEYVRKASDACHYRINFLLRSRPTRRGSAKLARYESNGRMVPLKWQHGVLCNFSRVDLSEYASPRRRRRIREEA